MAKSKNDNLFIGLLALGSIALITSSVIIAKNMINKSPADKKYFNFRGKWWWESWETYKRKVLRDYHENN